MLSRQRVPISHLFWGKIQPQWISSRLSAVLMKTLIAKVSCHVIVQGQGDAASFSCYSWSTMTIDLPKRTISSDIRFANNRLSLIECVLYIQEIGAAAPTGAPSHFRPSDYQWHCDRRVIFEFQDLIAAIECHGEIRASSSPFLSIVKRHTSANKTC